MNNAYSVVVSIARELVNAKLVGTVLPVVVENIGSLVSLEDVEDDLGGALESRQQERPLNL